MPVYEQKLQVLTSDVVLWLRSLGFDVADNIIREYVNPGVVMRTVASVFNGLGGVMTNTFLILFVRYFWLLEASGFPAKVKRAFGEETQAFAHFARFSEAVQQYLFIKTLVIWVPAAWWPCYWRCWGWITGRCGGWSLFLLNYIPNIGSIIARTGGTGGADSAGAVGGHADRRCLCTGEYPVRQRD